LANAVSSAGAQHSGHAKVLVGAFDSSKLLRQESFIHLEKRSRRYGDLHLVNAILTNTEIGMGTEAERRGVGPDVERAGVTLSPVAVRA